MIRRRDLYDGIQEELNCICGHCQGKGETKYYNGTVYPMPIVCPTCKGAGGLPWTTRMILGIRKSDSCYLPF